MLTFEASRWFRRDTRDSTWTFHTPPVRQETSVRCVLCPPSEEVRSVLAQRRTRGLRRPGGGAQERPRAGPLHSADLRRHRHAWQKGPAGCDAVCGAGFFACRLMGRPPSGCRVLRRGSARSEWSRSTTTRSGPTWACPTTPCRFSTSYGSRHEPGRQIWARWWCTAGFSFLTPLTLGSDFRVVG